MAMYPTPKMLAESKQRQRATAQGKAIAEIERRCRTGDKEINGSQLDHIMQDFLTEIGCSELAKTIGTVECWRA